MGSGSSKEAKKPEPAPNKKKEEPVANVNNQSGPANNNTAEKGNTQNTFITQPEESLEKKNNSLNNNRLSQVSRDEDSDSDVHVKKPSQDSFVWQADRETQEELNQVLQIPTHNSQPERPMVSSRPVRQEDLPETYAQRKQRQQYTLNQQMLLRQKTIYRNPDDWNEEEEDEPQGRGGFDPSKFRSANFGQPTKNPVFSTAPKQDESVQYMRGQQNMDEFDVNPHHRNMPRELPQYNASEQDLMASLERDLL